MATMTSVMDPYQTFIAAIQADEDCPPDLIATPLYAKGAVNFKREKTADADQWQIAIPLDTPIPDALDRLITQHERAVDRVAAAKLRADRQAQEQAAQAAFHDQMHALKVDQDKRLKTKRDMVKARHEPKTKN
jgi:hypothetical protein